MRRRRDAPRPLAAVKAISSLLVLLQTPAVGAEEHRYTIDPNHLTVAFLVEHVGYARVLGRFRQGEGSFRFDEESRQLRDVRVSVRTESVWSNQADRDRHLKSPDFLNVVQFPDMVFTAASGRLDADGRGRLEGELHLLGVAHPLVLDIVWNKSGVSPLPGPGGKQLYVLGASARGRFARSRWGMTYGVSNGLVGDEVELIIELEAWRE